MKNKGAQKISLQEAARISKALRARGKKLVTVNGSLDLLHSGHIFMLQKAAEHGDALLVLVNSDVSVRKYKGPHRPIIGEDERVRMVQGIAGVDYVALFDDINPKKVLEGIKPAVHCNGSDWGKNCVEREVVEKNGGSIKVLPKIKGLSTSKLIESIVKVAHDPSPKAVFVDRDGTINDNGDGYIHKKEHFTFLPGVLSALSTLTKTNYKIILVTNQSGIGRGLYSHGQVKELHDWMMGELTKQRIRIDKIYYCPHEPGDGCECRKPNIGMFEQAVKDFGISLAKSWFVGDSVPDVLAGREANIQTIKLGARMEKRLKLEPNYYAKDLKGAVSIILKSR